MDNLIWHISDHPDTATILPENDDEDLMDLTNEDWLTVPFENQGEIVLRLPTHRFSETDQSITIPKNATVKTILHKIYNFYQSHIDENEIFNSPEDCLGFVSWAKEQILLGNKPKWIEIMGDAIHFEGFTNFKNNIWFMNLGS